LITDRSIDSREIDRQQVEEIGRLIEKLTADTSIDGVSTGRRPINNSSEKIRSIDSREIDRQQQQEQQRY
jgi:hypothetical protein